MSGSCNVDYGDASFKDIEFEILPTVNTLGRRIVTTVYPFTANHYNEDLGREPEGFSVTGAFHGENARDKLTVAKRLWLLQGAGVFFEPTENKSHNVILKNLTFDFDNAKINFIPFSMELVADADTPYPTLTSGLFGQVNQIIDNYVNSVNTYYVESSSFLRTFSDIQQAINQAKTFLFDVTRQNVTSGFVNVLSSVNGFEASTSPDLNFSNFVNLYETAAEENVSINFFKQASEIRIGGTDTQKLQGSFVGLLALGYYFEKLTDQVSYGDLKDFRDRALSLKSSVAEVQPSAKLDAIFSELTSSIDFLISEIGRVNTFDTLSEIEGTHHALVASYDLYGNVSRAYEILTNSFGVSGAALDRVRYKA